jgi:predicted glycoside hydrolase/deacetylase ChbG (UPF0249 family)
MDRLIIRTDDAGSCEGANQGILAAAGAGLARNVSVMTVGPAFNQAAGTLTTLQGVSFGLHFVLTSEWDGVRWGPLSDVQTVPELIEPDGTFPRTGQLVHDRKPDLGQVRRELVAQYERALQAGFTIEYVDEHMGIGWAAGIRQVVTEFCAEEELIAADALPLIPVAPPRSAGEWGGWAKSLRNEAACGLWVTHPSTRTKDADRQFIEGQPEGAVAAERDEERQLLISTELRLALQQASIVPATYPEIAELSLGARSRV